MSVRHTVDVVLRLTHSELVLLDVLLKQEFDKNLSERLGEVLLRDNIINIRRQLPRGVLCLLRGKYKEYADILTSPLFQLERPGSGLEQSTMEKRKD